MLRFPISSCVRSSTFLKSNWLFHRKNYLTATKCKRLFLSQQGKYIILWCRTVLVPFIYHIFTFYFKLGFLEEETNPFHTSLKADVFIIQAPGLQFLIRAHLFWKFSPSFAPSSSTISYLYMPQNLLSIRRLVPPRAPVLYAWYNSESYSRNVASFPS